MNFFGASPQVLPLPCDSSQFRRAPTSSTTSASGSTKERAAEADIFPDREHFGRIFFNQANMSALGKMTLSM